MHLEPPNGYQSVVCRMGNTATTEFLLDLEVVARCDATASVAYQKNRNATTGPLMATSYFKILVSLE